MPPNLADFDNVDWDYIGVWYLWGEVFDEVEDM
jgi:hypothetical protein